MLSPDIIAGIKSLLLRVQISGAEVPAFNRVVQALLTEERLSAAPPEANTEERDA